ncbi:hypothetical protein PIROE2DRAFT_7575, partial [Piromyces sp. E2]
LFDYDFGDIYISNSNFTDISNCNNDYVCFNTNDNEMINLHDESNITISNTDFLNIYGFTGFRVGKKCYINIEESNFRYISLEEGFIIFDTIDVERYGVYEISDTLFYSFISYSGVILTVYDITSLSQVNFNRCIFKENIVTYNGAIVYSISENAKDFIKFNNCTFEDNFAEL